MGIIGAILGDIAGSRFEFKSCSPFGPRRTQNYELFDTDCFITDDTVMSIACMDACHHRYKFAKYYRKYGRMYPDAGYGSGFRSWIFDKKRGPYNSYGNGSAMRCSYIGQYVSPDKVEYIATLSASCTHNHLEGIKGAVVLAKCVNMAQRGISKEKILEYGIRAYPYDERLYPYSCDVPTSEYCDTIRYQASCQGSVPVAIRCFYETDTLEECLYLVNSMSIDTDTVGAIAGAICDSFYGTTDKAIETVRQYLQTDENNLLWKQLEKRIPIIKKS